MMEDLKIIIILNLKNIFLQRFNRGSYHELNSDNSFIVFKSINNIFYLIYKNEFNSIISYD